MASSDCREAQSGACLILDTTSLGFFFGVSHRTGIKSLNTRDFMSYYNESKLHTPSFQFVTRAFSLAKKADFVLHNTVQELESSVLLALNICQPNYAIGPIFFYRNSKDIFHKSLWSESDCTHWLQSKATGSVLYISFGSLVPASKQVVEEIANGLILSQVNFIWVTRDGALGSDLQYLPVKFKEDFKDKGLIVPWCNQNMVLSNPAIFGFLTHCGWNSVVESIWHGIPMLCCPVDYDQPEGSSERNFDEFIFNLKEKHGKI